MHKAHLRRLFGNRLQAQRLHRRAVAARFSQAEFPARQVGGVEEAFFGAGEDGDDAAEGRGGAEVGEEVEDEAHAGVVGEGEGHVELFGGFCDFFESTRERERERAQGGGGGGGEMVHTSPEDQAPLALKQ